MTENSIHEALGMTKSEAILIAMKHNPFDKRTREWSEYIKQVMQDETLTLEQRGYALFMAGQTVEHARNLQDILKGLEVEGKKAKKEAKDATLN